MKFYLNVEETNLIKQQIFYRFAFIPTTRSHFFLSHIDTKSIKQKKCVQMFKCIAYSSFNCIFARVSLFSFHFFSLFKTSFSFRTEINVLAVVGAVAIRVNLLDCFTSSIDIMSV